MYKLLYYDGGVCMSLLSDIKFFLKKYLKNPVIVSVTAYLVYRILSKHLRREQLAESIQEIDRVGSRILTYDDALKRYIMLDLDSGKVFSSEDKDSIVQLMQGEDSE